MKSKVSKRPILVFFAAIALLALIVNPVLAWTKPAVSPLCAENENTYSWIVTLSGNEPNYNFDWSFDKEDWTKVSGVKGDNPLTTPRGGDTLFVRWSSDHKSVGSAEANGELCYEPTPTPEPSDEPTPTPTEEPTPEPTVTPTPTPEPSVTPTPEPSDEPTPEPTDKPTLPPTDAPGQSSDTGSSSMGIYAVFAVLAGSVFLALLKTPVHDRRKTKK